MSACFEGKQGEGVGVHQFSVEVLSFEGDISDSIHFKFEIFFLLLKSNGCSKIDVANFTEDHNFFGKLVPSPYPSMQFKILKKFAPLIEGPG